MKREGMREKERGYSYFLECKTSLNKIWHVELVFPTSISKPPSVKHLIVASILSSKELSLQNYFLLSLLSK